ncbi:MAG: diguanylate cyclase [Acidobacteria bacterium]|nr:diguanylate cyclase [Acidobacteriota bacterium]
MHVLIADDSQVSRHLLGVTLKNWGYRVVVACDGTEAWQILQREDAPQLAILDWIMPGLSGVEVCRLVRQKAGEAYTYILLLTSKSLKEDMIAGMDSGADDYLTKPFDQHELKVRLRAGKRILDLQTELLATREALRVQATRDYLTSVWNRSTVLEILKKELSRSERERTPVGVGLLDLDHFKAINDTHGHLVGDLVLQEATRRMQVSVRPYDSVGRFGGEEFIVVLPGCGEDATRNYAERIRFALESEAIQFPDLELSVSASFGCTSAIASPSLRPEHMVHAADEALYEAKRRGRNRIVYFSPESIVNDGPVVATVARGGIR